MHISVTTKTNNAGKIRALIDSGAQGKFIDKVVALKLGLKETPLQQKIPVYNVDGTPNKLEQIRTKVELPITIGGRHIKEELYVTHLGKNEIILGFDWLQKHNPCINWKAGTLDFEDRKVLIEDEEELFTSQINALPVNHPHVIEEALKVQIEDGMVPAKGSREAAGFDLYAAEDMDIPAGQRRKVRTGIKAKAPPGTYLRIASRSRLALKGIDAVAGVVDRDYTGEISVILHNSSQTGFTIARQDRIAQLIPERIAYPAVHTVDQLGETERGAGGFRSTGLNNNFRKLLDTTVRAIRLANDPAAPVRIQVCETTAIEDERELTDEELVYMYEPGVSRITTTTLDEGLGKAIASLSIRKANNPAMELAQKANAGTTTVEIPDYLKPYASVFEKKAAERFPEERPYDHAIELKADFVPKDCKVYQLTPEEDRKLTEFLDENLKKGYI